MRYIPPDSRMPKTLADKVMDYSMIVFALWAGLLILGFLTHVSLSIWESNYEFTKCVLEMP